MHPKKLYYLIMPYERYYKKYFSDFKSVVAMKIYIKREIL